MQRRYKLSAIFLTAFYSVSLAQNYGNWIITDSLHKARMNHAGVQLENGDILITGGYTRNEGSGSNDTELFDVKTQKWANIVPMNDKRAFHDLIKLNDSSILAIGGFSKRTCEILSNDFTKWNFTDSLNIRKHNGQKVVLMQDGNVISIGGFLDTSYDTVGSIKECEIYNYLNRKWELTTNLNTGRSNHTATLLKDGRILVTGGHGKISLSSCEIYDPIVKKWTNVTSMHYPREKHSATLLSNGKVLVIGGVQNIPELYNPITDQWELVGAVNKPSLPVNAVKLEDEKYLLIVHNLFYTRYAWELYSLKNFQSLYYKEFDRRISDQVVLNIDDKKVLVAGGSEIIIKGTSFFMIYTNFCQIYDINYTSVSVKEIVNQNHLQTDISLSCYPNPSNNSTNIIANLNSSGWTKIKVYNILGSEISTIYNGDLAAGRHEFRYDMERFPSGIYFYSVTFKNQTLYKKMSLMK